MQLDSIGTLARLRHLIHTVDPSPTGSIFAGDRHAGRLCAGESDGGFRIASRWIAWCPEGVVALVWEADEEDRPALHVVREIEHEAPALERATESLRDYFGTYAEEFVSASYWATREQASAGSLADVGKHRSLEWYGHTLEAAKAAVQKESASLPPPLLDLAFWLHEVSAERRHAISEEEQGGWQRLTDGELRVVAELGDQRTVLASAGIDWRETTPMSSILEPPAPLARAVVGELGVALHEATARGDVGRVQQLLDAGADPNVLGWHGELGLPSCRPLTIAWERGEHAALRALLARGARPLLAWNDGHVRRLAADADVGDAIVHAVLLEQPSLFERSARPA